MMPLSVLKYRLTTRQPSDFLFMFLSWSKTICYFKNAGKRTVHPNTMKAQANWKESCLEQLWFKLGLYFLNALEANFLSSEQGDRAAQGREAIPILTVI